MGNQPWAQFQNGIRERSVTVFQIYMAVLKTKTYPSKLAAFPQTAQSLEICDSNMNDYWSLNE